MSKWVQPESIRTPVTPEEAQAALDLIDTAMDRLEGLIARKERQGEPQDKFRHLLRTWELKRAEVAYALERLDAGEAAPSIELATARAKIEALEKKLAERSSGWVRAPAQNAKHLAEIERQNVDLVAKNKNLAASLAQLHAAIARKSEERPATVRAMHRVYATILDCFADMERRGIALPPIARLLRGSAASGLPAGYYETTWAMDGRPHLLEAAAALSADASTPETTMGTTKSGAREIEERARREGAEALTEALTEARRVLHFARVAAEVWEAASLRGDGPSMDRLDAAMRDLVDEAGDWSLSGPLTTTDALAAARDDARVERDAMRTQRDAAWAQGAEAMRAAARVAVWRALESRASCGPVPHILADAAIRALPLPEVSRG